MGVRRLYWISLGLALLAGCATPRPRPEIPRDRFGLAAQPQVYIVHHTAGRPFRVERKNTVNHTNVVFLINFESARLAQRLDLQDPVGYLKDHLAESLRREIALTNVRIETTVLDLPIIAKDAVDAPADEEATPTPGDPVQDPPTTRREVTQTTETFQTRHPTGAVIEIVTVYWGMHDYRMRYAARVRVFDLAQSRELLRTSCPWVMFDQVDKKDLPPPTGYDQRGNYNPNVLPEYNAAMEAKLYADDGTLLKANLRKAAEICADRIVSRLVLGGKSGKQ